ncbi:hypothetical protein SDC9_48815 [bioreactor metagenome]|jgi:hypothetical protein|uniref:Uncharacterized protein n=1 Tax=bioreactor metagenome TaxID=1076179 RepID=A0A644WFE6_9ZZZZ
MILIKRIFNETYEITNYDREIECDNFVIKEGYKSIKNVG